MAPSELQAEQFSGYAPEARELAIANIALLQRLPLSFLPLLLREVIAYDYKFPAERKELDRQFMLLRALKPAALQEWMGPFSSLKLTPELGELDWVNTPAQFSEKLTAHLWATHQIDAFRKAAMDYVGRLNASAVDEALAAPRLAVVIVGSGVSASSYPLFRKLRPQGVRFTQVDPENGARILLDAVNARAAAYPVPFGHWYVDGGEAMAGGRAELTSVSYASLEPVRVLLLSAMDKTMRSGAGSEALRSQLAKMRPEDVGLIGAGEHAVLNHFQLSLLTEGSGTQIFSTTFVQWSARELLRRAQPLTLLARFAPRRHEQSMSETLSSHGQKPALDPEGSLVDADMGAYYTWINQQRLPHADESRFLVWFEGHREALAIGPSLPRGKESGEKIRLDTLITRLSSS
jgi:hypothetical protein